MKTPASVLVTLFLTILTLSVASTAKVAVELKDAQGKSVGSALMYEGDGMVIQLDLHDLPPGDHGIHIHQNAKCDPPDFKSAGPHFNPENRKHGLENPEGHHAGDLQNITVNADGRAKTQIVTKDVNRQVSTVAGSNSLQCRLAGGADRIRTLSTGSGS